jgi:hypothetical protein
MPPPAGGEPAPDAVHDLTRAEFSALLQSSFPHVSIYAQRPLLGSALMAEHVAPETAPLLTYERRGGRFFEASIGLPRPLSLVAVASDAAVVPCIGSLYIETSDIEAIFAASVATKREVQSLTKRLERQDEQLTELASLRQQLIKRDEAFAALVEANGRLLQQRADRYARHEAAFRAVLDPQAAMNPRATQQLSKLQAEIETLRTELASRLLKIGTGGATGNAIPFVVVDRLAGWGCVGATRSAASCSAT